MVVERDLAQRLVALLLVELRIGHGNGRLDLGEADPLPGEAAGMQTVDRPHHVVPGLAVEVVVEHHAVELLLAVAPR